MKMIKNQTFAWMDQWVEGIATEIDSGFVTVVTKEDGTSLFITHQASHLETLALGDEVTVRITPTKTILESRLLGRHEKKRIPATLNLTATHKITLQCGASQIKILPNGNIAHHSNLFYVKANELLSLNGVAIRVNCDE